MHWPHSVRTNVSGNAALGFTLIELMVVVMLVAVLATIAAPSFSNMVKSSRIKGAASNLHMALLKARSEAVKRNASVRVLPVDADNWGAGWSVEVVSDGTVLSTQAAAEGISITNDDDPANVIYLRSGRIQGGPPAAFAVVPEEPIELASARTDRCRSVSIGPSGIPTVGKQDCPVPP